MKVAQPTAGGAAPAGLEIAYVPTGKSEKVAGLACQGYTEKLGERPIAESCMVDWAKTGFTEADRAPLMAMREVLLGARGPTSGEGPKAPGFAARRTSVGNGPGAGEADVLISIAHGAIEASVFAEPQGYTPAP